MDALACEDTRRTRKILQHYEVRRPPVVISYREHTEQRAGARILGLLEQGKSVALCSDAGYPGVSDPGYRIVSAALDLGYRVEVLPGAGAVSAALVASGLPTSSYTFKGFPPRKRGRRRRFLEMEADSSHTLVLFESPHRAAGLLEEAQEVLGDRMAAVCIDLTKKFERVERGNLSELLERLRDREVKGEVTVVIAGLDEYPCRCHWAKSKTSMGMDLEALASPWTIWRTLSAVSRLKDCSPHRHTPGRECYPPRHTVHLRETPRPRVPLYRPRHGRPRS